MTQKTKKRGLARCAVLAAVIGIGLATPGPATPTSSTCIPVPPPLAPAWGSASICGG
jgi:hypothetical protein